MITINYIIHKLIKLCQQHGFKAVYVEGIRGSHPDSELLVFYPKNLKLIREEKP